MKLMNQIIDEMMELMEIQMMVLELSIANRSSRAITLQRVNLFLET